MGEENSVDNWRRVMSPEIVEIGEDSKSTIIGSRDEGVGDVFIAVGKNDLVVVKWAIDHAVSPGARVYLVHVFPTISYIPTPVFFRLLCKIRRPQSFPGAELFRTSKFSNQFGISVSKGISANIQCQLVNILKSLKVGRLSRSQLSREQVQIFITEENNRRRNLLQKYIRLCTDAKVAVDTMLLESNDTAKAILDLIPVLNITNLIMGIKGPPSFRRLRTGVGKGEFVRKNAPDFCEVTIVHDGKKVTNNQPQLVSGDVPPARSCSETAPQSERKFFECICFSGKFD